MTAEPRYLEFHLMSLDDVVAEMDALSQARAGWINFEPAVDVDDLPPPSASFFSLFSSRGPEVPLGTWTPASSPRRGRAEPAMIGLQHAAGTRAKTRLAELDHAVPESWVVIQDYVKKGLVIAVPPGVPHADVVTWLLRAASVLSRIPLAGTWRAAIYEG